MSGGLEWRDTSGLFHRDGDLPAVIKLDGTRQWYQHGKLHRDDDRPAVEQLDGTRQWWWYGLPHRDNGPALIQPSLGSESWYHHGRIHRIDGPAYVLADGRSYWWLDDERVSDTEMDAIHAAQDASLNSDQALFLLTHSPQRLLPTIHLFIARNPSEFLSNRVRGLAALTT